MVFWEWVTQLFERQINNILKRTIKRTMKSSKYLNETTDMHHYILYHNGKIIAEKVLFVHLDVGPDLFTQQLNFKKQVSDNLQIPFIDISDKPEE